MNADDLKKVLAAHELWLKSNGSQGERADLSYADLRGADLSGAYLDGADLIGADLTNANLIGADLTNANPVSYTHLTLPTKRIV